MARLEVDLPPLRLRNPILSASGTYGHGLEMQHIVAPHLLGGLVSKTVTLAPRPGNPLPRICETEAGFLNSIGLENKGIHAYLRDVLPAMSAADCAVITNIGGERVEDFAELAALLSEQPAVDALEVNLSCPNVQGGKLPFSDRTVEFYARSILIQNGGALTAKVGGTNRTLTIHLYGGPADAPPPCPGGA